MNEEKQEERKERSLEEAFQELDILVKKLESGQLSLEETFQTYQKGMDLVQECGRKVDLVEKKVLEMDEKGNLHEF